MKGNTPGSYETKLQRLRDEWYDADDRQEGDNDAALLLAMMIWLEQDKDGVYPSLAIH